MLFMQCCIVYARRDGCHIQKESKGWMPRQPDKGAIFGFLAAFSMSPQLSNGAGLVEEGANAYNVWEYMRRGID